MTTNNENAEDESPDNGEAFTPVPDYGAYDYLRLPGLGEGYYNLSDAALLVALDQWSSNQIASFPVGDFNWMRDSDHPDVRAGVESLREQIYAALIRSVEANHVGAKVLGRTLEDSKLVPERTYIHLSELSEWLELYGLGRGDFLAEIEQEGDHDPWDVAESIARRRAEFRHPPAVDLDSHAAFPPANELDMLRHAVREQNLHIAHLEGRRRSPSEDKNPLGTRERNTLLCIIAAVCYEAKISYEKAAKAATMIQSSAGKIGLNIGETTIEQHLKRVPQAIESRTRIAR